MLYKRLNILNTFSFLLLTSLIAGYSFINILVSLIDFSFYVADVNIVVYYITYSIFWFFVLFSRLTILVVSSFVFKKYCVTEEFQSFMSVTVTLIFLSIWSYSIVFNEIYVTLLFTNELNRVRYEFSVFCSNIIGNLFDFYILGLFFFFLIFSYAFDKASPATFGSSQSFSWIFKWKRAFTARNIIRAYGILFFINFFFGESVGYSFYRFISNWALIELLITTFTFLRILCSYKCLQKEIKQVND